MRIKLTVMVVVAAVTASLAGPLYSGNSALRPPATRVIRRDQGEVTPTPSGVAYTAIDGVQLSDYVSPGQAVCVFKADTTGFDYQVHIGRPYVNGQGCDPVHDTLEHHINTDEDKGNFDPEKWFCVQDGFGMTMLTFRVGDNKDKDPATQYRVIEGLDEAYPGIPFKANRICLSGVPAPDGWPCEGPTCTKKIKRREDASHQSLVRQVELDLWGIEWAPAKIAATAEDPLHILAAKTNVAGVIGYELQIDHPYDPRTICEYLLDNLQQAADNLEIGEWGCRDDTLGGTQIKFTAGLRNGDPCQPGIYDKINEAFPDLQVLEKAPRLFGDCQPPMYWPHSSYPSTPIIP